MNGRTYQWIIGILMALLLAAGGVMGGSVITANSIEQELREHVIQPAHPESSVEMRALQYRLERVENKQDQILELLRDLR